MKEELLAITTLPGISATCCHRGGRILHHTFSPAYGPATATALSAAVSAVFQAYHSAGRPVMEAYMQFPECGIFIISQDGGKKSDGLFLSFMIHDTAVLPQVIGPARAFLARHSTAAAPRQVRAVSLRPLPESEVSLSA